MKNNSRQVWGLSLERGGGGTNHTSQKSFLFRVPKENFFLMREKNEHLITRATSERESAVGKNLLNNSFTLNEEYNSRKVERIFMASLSLPGFCSYCNGEKNNLPEYCRLLYEIHKLENSKVPTSLISINSKINNLCLITNFQAV